MFLARINVSNVLCWTKCSLVLERNSRKSIGTHDYRLTTTHVYKPTHTNSCCLIQENMLGIVTIHMTTTRLTPHPSHWANSLLPLHTLPPLSPPFQLPSLMYIPQGVLASSNVEDQISNTDLCTVQGLPSTSGAEYPACFQPGTK